MEPVENTKCRSELLSHWQDVGPQAFRGPYQAGRMGLRVYVSSRNIIKLVVEVLGIWILFYFSNSISSAFYTLQIYSMRFWLTHIYLSPLCLAFHFWNATDSRTWFFKFPFKFSFLKFFWVTEMQFMPNIKKLQPLASLSASASTHLRGVNCGSEQWAVSPVSSSPSYRNGLQRRAEATLLRLNFKNRSFCDLSD